MFMYKSLLLVFLHFLFIWCENLRLDIHALEIRATVLFIIIIVHYDNKGIKEQAIANL